MRAAVDVMGGDKAPAAILKGCWEAAPLLDANDTVLLVGDKDAIAQFIGWMGELTMTNPLFNWRLYDSVPAS